MTDYRIDCTTKDGPDPDYCIDGFGGIDPTTGRRWFDTLDQLLASLDAGHTFWVMVDGRRAEVVPRLHPRSGRRFAMTIADGFPPNNLMNLPNCR